jgi:predicted N-acetyltransferase YhbS
MTSLQIRELDALDAGAAIGLCNAYAYDDYRRYRRIAPAHAHAYLVERVQRAAAGAATLRLGAFDERGELVGLLLLQPLADDSALFGMRMAGVPFALVRHGHAAPRHVLRSLLAALPELVARERIVHVAFRVDTADIDAYQEFTSAGFRLVETLVSMTYDTERRGGGVVDPREHGFDGAIRPVVARDVPAIEELAARSFTLNRYHLDEHLPKRDAGLLMARWAASYCEQHLAARGDAFVWVAEAAGGRLAGFLGHKLDRELERHTGVRVSGRALLAVADPRSGVGRMLSQHHVWTSAADYKDADTQLNNYGMIKVSFDLDMEMVRTKYTFHRWYGG